MAKFNIFTILGQLANILFIAEQAQEGVEVLKDLAANDYPAAAAALVEIPRVATSLAPLDAKPLAEPITTVGAAIRAGLPDLLSALDGAIPEEQIIKLLGRLGLAT